LKQQTFGKGILHGWESFLWRLLGLKDQTVYTNFKKILLEVSFSRLNSVCSKLFKKENTLFLSVTKLRKIGFQVWRNLSELSKRENLILCECDWDYSSLGRILELWLSLQFAWVRSVAVRRKFSFFWEWVFCPSLGETRTCGVLVSKGVGH